MKIENDKIISKEDIIVLLDWFDKVRVGLWIGFLYLDKNYFNIIPNFYINNRIGISDRMLFISIDNYNKKNLSFCGVNTPLFSLIPSVFSLRINNAVFTNVSFFNSLLRRLGFPFLIDTQLEKDGYISTSIHDGFNRIMLPIIRKKLPAYNLKIYQPIYSSLLQIEEIKPLFNTQYVLEHSDGAGSGGIFYEIENNNVKYLCNNDEITLNCSKYKDYDKNVLDTVLSVHELQMMTKIQSPPFKEEDPQESQLIKRQYEFAMDYNKKIINMLKKH